MTIDIIAVNDSPVANIVTNSLDEDTSVLITLNASDVDSAELTYTIVTPPTNGTLTATDDANIFTYSANENFNGTDSFTYRVNDGEIDSTTANVTIDIIAVNDSPVANIVSSSLDEDTPVLITLNVTDVESANVTYTIVTQPSNGILTATDDANIFTYSANENFNGTDSFTYRVNDGEIDSNTAQVDINVTAINDSPIANIVSSSLDEDTPVLITLNATDIESADLTYTIVTQPSNGILTATDDANIFTYSANENFNGTDSFTYRVNDGEIDSNTAQVDINVTAINDSPIANVVTSSLDEDTSILITLNAIDVDSAELTYTIVTQPSNGTLTVTDDANIFTYLANENYYGEDNFTYRVNDGETDSSIATVTIDITAINDSPVAEVDSIETEQGSGITIDVLANDHDIEGDTLTIINAEVSSGAGLVEISNGFLLYIPTNNFTGTAIISYNISDNNNAVDSSTVNVVVNNSENIEINSNSSSGGSMAYLILFLLSITVLRFKKLIA